MKRLFLPVLFAALVLAACGRGGPQPAAHANAFDTTDPTDIVATTTTTDVSPTTVPPTTMPPTTVPTPTTVGPFSVRDITVSMQDCRHGFPPQGGAGSTYGCLGTFAVHLNPGIGGHLTWKATWDTVGACDEPQWEGYEPRITEGVLDVPNGAKEVTGKLAIFSENDFNPRLVANGVPATRFSKIQVAVTGDSTGTSALTPFYGDGDCTVAGAYNSPSYGSAVQYP